MTAGKTDSSRLAYLIWSAAPVAAALLIAGAIGQFWFVLANDSAWKGVPLTAVLALTAVVGITWQQTRARGRRRWQAALDTYAEREIGHERRRIGRGRDTALEDFGAELAEAAFPVALRH